MSNRSEMIEELNKLKNQEGRIRVSNSDYFFSTAVSQYGVALTDFAKWHVDNQSTKDLREHLRSHLEEVLANNDTIDKTLESISDDEIFKSCYHAYKKQLSKMTVEEVADEMLSWGYQSPHLKKDEEHIYLLVKLTVDGGTDHEEAVNECDYVFTHDHILGSEILDYRSEQQGESPVLYFP